jgi:hypothetical protein|tara:strand:+ start:345 stop:533 length:189 start_codon:yes stop_codon:yes gene_type:complete
MIKEYLKIIGLGILAVIFHWKTIAFYLFMAFCFCLMLIQQGLLAALMIIPIIYFLKLIGKIF